MHSRHFSRMLNNQSFRDQDLKKEQRQFKTWERSSIVVFGYLHFKGSCILETAHLKIPRSMLNGKWQQFALLCLPTNTYQLYSILNVNGRYAFYTENRRIFVMVWRPSICTDSPLFLLFHMLSIEHKLLVIEYCISGIFGRGLILAV